MELWHVLSILTCALNCWEILLTTERFRYVIYSTCLAGHMTTHSATIINSRCGPEWAVCVAKEVEQGVAAISKPCHYQDSNKYFVVLYLPVRLWQSRFVISLCVSVCMSICPPDNLQTQWWMSTILGRHGKDSRSINSVLRLCHCFRYHTVVS